MRKTKDQQLRATQRLKQELLGYYGEDVSHLDGTVIRLYKQFNENEEPFTYVAVKVGPDNWYLNGEYRTWTGILLFLDKDNILMHGNLIDKATAWEEVDSAPPF